MNEKQKEIALKEIHSVMYQESVSNVSVLDKSVNDGENLICAEMVDAGIDWIPAGLSSTL